MGNYLKDIALIYEKMNNTMSLNDIYGNIKYDIPEDEALYHAVDPEMGDIQIPIKILSPEQLSKLTTYNDDTTVIQAYKDFADKEQKQIVNYYKKSKELHENPIVIDNNTALDGYHRIVAAILTKQSLKVLDISDI